MDRSNDESNRVDWTGGGDPGGSSDPIARNDKDLDQPEGAQPAKVSRRRRANEDSENVPAIIEQTQAPEARRDQDVPAPSAVPVSSTTPTPSVDRSWGLNLRAQSASSSAELLTSVLRFKWTLVAVSILVSLPLIVAIWTLTVPKYQARAEVRVRPIIPRLVFRTDENGMIPLYDSFVNTQVSFIRGPTVLQRVLDQQEIRGTQWYRNPSRSLMQQVSGYTAPPMERMRDGLSVRPRPRTEIIDISFADPVAKDARLIVDAVLDQYIKFITERSDATELDLDRKLADQHRMLGNEIKSIEDVCAKLHAMLGTEVPQDLIASKRVRLDEAQAHLNTLRNGIAILEWKMAQVRLADGNDNDTSTAETARQPKYHDDEEWRRLDLDAKRIQHQITNGVYGPNHPEGIRMRKDLAFAEELVRAREAQLDERWRDQLMSTQTVSVGADSTDSVNNPPRTMPIEYQLAQAKQEEELLRTDLAAQEVEFKRLFESAQSLERENSTLRQKRELFDAVRQRLDQKNIERGVAGSIEVLTRAFSGSRPDQDRRAVFTLLALMLGLGVGGGAAFLRASRNQGIYAPKDMPHAMQVPFLGHLPLIRTRGALGGSRSDEIMQKQFLLLESVRLVRTALLSRLDPHRTTLILITSATSGTGKSNFTMILGRSLAQAGKRILMIDVDFYKRTLSKRFDVLDKPGLLNCLHSQSVEAAHILPTETPGLCIMSAGKRSDDSTAIEEIANGRFKACMDQVTKQGNYDVVLLDSSPILLSADATILAGQVDGTIMVERENVSRRSSVTNALTRLNCAGGRLLGTVFIGSAIHDNADYGYTYDRYRHGA